MKIKANDYKPNELLKFVRQYSNYTQEELAKKMNKSKNWIKNNEQGLNRYFFEDMLKICELCGVEIIFQSKK